ACSRRAAASSGVQPCRISIAFLRLPPACCSASWSSSSLRLLKPPQYIFAAPNKLGIDCLDIDHETFVNRAKPRIMTSLDKRLSATRCAVPAFIRVEPAIGDRCQAKLDNSRFPIIRFRFLLAFQRNLACSRLSLWP